ncbi:MAG TPA: hypothetical protein VJ551_01685 [Nitrososphaeraceae archaeon]|nr:hypothetical protein [Nitrososphaeraceae archaeon]
MLSDNRDKDGVDDTAAADGNSTESRKLWVVEWKKTLGKTLSIEKYNYAEALAIFDQKTSSGIDVILYEVHRSPLDSSVIKKTPILNSVKARQRRKEESENTRHEDQAKQTAKRDNKPVRIKYRIILLIIVIGVLVLVISLLNALSNRGGIMVNPHFTVSIVDDTMSEHESLASLASGETILDL